MLIQAHGNIGW